MIDIAGFSFKDFYDNNYLCALPHGALDALHTCFKAVYNDKNLKQLLIGEIIRLREEPPVRKTLTLSEEYQNADKILGGHGLFGALALYLSAGHLNSRFKLLGYPENMVYDELSDLRIWMQDYYDRHSAWGLSTYPWVSYHFTGGLFSLGRLQFELSVFTDDINLRSNRDERLISLHKGDHVIGVHIPAGTPMTPNACAESVKLALAFFPKYFNDYSPKGFTCGSWLLDKAFEKILPPQSNIRLFSLPFIIYKTTDEDEATWDRVFWGKPNDMQKAPRDTSLRRAMIDYALSGGKFGSGYGFIPWDDAHLWEEMAKST